MITNTLRIHEWAPNGTNDIEVLNELGECILYIEECLFGCPTGKKEFLDIDGKDTNTLLGVIYNKIASSPINDGEDNLIQLIAVFNLMN